ncbi:alpha/beta hydrolase family protein [Actinomadura parmotrematis]|uniref:Alpha/beta fold hydrolase n=1 Tax=Actinomadura parmotrematis TaxID=2864039 RepID=A0ABS7FPC5_9ACTN|nr:alpha/beta hydrolase [Actinomadura parmotrematis]MBW8481437.1 alpha/beta fold hydrolase [Actinomadura parmotrematis]
MSTRTRRLALFSALAAVLLAVSATAGIGWYFSGVATEVSHTSDYDLTVRASAPGTVTLPRTATTARPGTWGLSWPGGHAVLGAVTATARDSVTRAVASGTPPAPGTRATIDHWVWSGSGPDALGLSYTAVTYPTENGAMPAWYLPAAGRTWVVAVHGHNADKAETMRAMRTVHAAGLPMLSIAYRNDEGAPASPDGKNHLGDTEWHDVRAAVAYARAHGATGVVLYGWSMGGAMALRTLRAEPSLVRGVVLDSPVMDWDATLDKQAAARGLPSFVTAVAERTLEWRIGISLREWDQTRYASSLKVPVLLYTATEDGTVDNRPALEFARRAPAGLVTHLAARADHTEAWNVDPAVYERALASFLSRVAPA